MRSARTVLHFGGRAILYTSEPGTSTHSVEFFMTSKPVPVLQYLEAKASVISLGRPGAKNRTKIQRFHTLKSHDLMPESVCVLSPTSVHRADEVTWNLPGRMCVTELVDISAALSVNTAYDRLCACV